MSFSADALEHDRGPTIELDALGKRNLAVFEAVAQGRHRYGPEAVGYFIVSGTQGADDILAALLLARWASVYDKRTGEVALDIAPQFESVDALERCGQTMQELLADRLYRRHLEAHGRQQCVMLGYSDSNKEVGTCASRMAIHQAQRSLAQVLAAAGDRTVVFHARGGSLARGGGRIDAIVMAAPAGAVNGVLRIREQGETIKQGYGLRPIAMRTLERAFNALTLTTSAAKRDTLSPDSPGFLACATTLADASRAAYRALAYEPEFFEYFRAVTPHRRDRADADRLALHSPRRASRHRRAAARAVGVRLDADPAHDSGLVRSRHRPARRPAETRAAARA